MKRALPDPDQSPSSQSETSLQRHRHSPDTAADSSSLITPAVLTQPAQSTAETSTGSQPIQLVFLDQQRQQSRQQSLSLSTATLHQPLPPASLPDPSLAAATEGTTIHDSSESNSTGSTMPVSTLDVIDSSHQKHPLSSLPPHHDDYPAEAEKHGLSSKQRGKTIVIVFSSGDLGDVGRHAIEAALEYPPEVISSVRVVSTPRGLASLISNCRGWDETTNQDESLTHLDSSSDVEAERITGSALSLYVAGSRSTSAGTEKLHSSPTTTEHQLLVDFANADRTGVQWKCGCRTLHSQSFSNEAHRLLFFSVGSSSLSHISPIALAPYLADADVVISCLGNRLPFHPDCVAKAGTERILQAFFCDPSLLPTPAKKRFILLSSVGIRDDWPPMEWCREGARLQAFYRTICWRQYQDLVGAEMAVLKAAQFSFETDNLTSAVIDSAEANSGHRDDTASSTLQQRSHTSSNQYPHMVQLDYLIVRTVLLPETIAPTGQYTVQEQKYHDHPNFYMAKMDCARFLLAQAVTPTLSGTAVVVGGEPSLNPLPLSPPYTLDLSPTPARVSTYP
jgi:hypothetical protein